VSMSRRNEAAYGTKAIIGCQDVNTTGDDTKTFQAAIIEYSKDQPAAKVQCLQCYTGYIVTLFCDIQLLMLMHSLLRCRVKC